MNLGDLLALAVEWDARCGNSSSTACIEDCTAAIYRGDQKAARMWAIRSLAHSVGILHHAYKQATA